MNRLFASAVVLSLVALPAAASLKPPASAPDFSARASLAGKEFDFSLRAALKKGPVVVYFYPSAYTGGCNLEAHTFAENKDKFDAAGATIIGVSQDSIQRLDDFSADPQYCASKFPVASDAQGAITKSYALSSRGAMAGFKDSRGNVLDHAFTERTTFVIAQDDKIVATFSSAEDKLSPIDHVNKSLAIVQQIAASKGR